MNKINQGVLKVISNYNIWKEYYNLTFSMKDTPEIGQFLMLEIPSSIPGNPILKKPFSISSHINKDVYSIVYKVNPEGRGTPSLANSKPGDELNYLGPLGKEIDLSVLDKNNICHLIAGGVGIAPIIFLAQKLINKHFRVLVHLGMKELDPFLDFCIRNLLGVGVDKTEICICVESLSLMEKSYFQLGEEKLNSLKCNTYLGISIASGNILQSLNFLWGDRMRHIRGPVFACVPKAITEYLHERISVKMGKDLYLFMEEKMACGCGVCGGCDVNGISICKEGPCVNSKHIFKER